MGDKSYRFMMKRVKYSVLESYLTALSWLFLELAGSSKPVQMEWSCSSMSSRFYLIWPLAAPYSIDLVVGLILNNPSHNCHSGYTSLIESRGLHYVSLL